MLMRYVPTCVLSDILHHCSHPIVKMLYFVVICATLQISMAGDLPSYMPRCHVDDPKINECILNATEVVRPFLRKGIPELGIPSFDPLIIPAVHLQQGTDAVNYKVNLSNLTIYGFDRYNFTDFGYNPETLTFYGTGAFNLLSLTANYDISGKILAVPIKGRGTYRAELESSIGRLSVTGELVKQNGEEYYNPKTVKATIMVGGSKGNFDGLFNGNKELSQVTNQVLNENSKEILKEVLPAVEKVAEEIINQIMLGINKNVPYKKLLPPLH